MVASQETKKSAIVPKLKQLFGFDLRSLAIFRIGVATIIIADLTIRFWDIRTLYSDEGVLPRSALREILNPLYWSVHTISGQPWVQGLLFLLAFVFALALLVGYRTRLAAIAVWAMTLSLQHRNPALLFAADDMLRALLFWSMFLPLGARYSIDSALNSSPRPLPKSILTGATFALGIQIYYIYAWSAAFKTSSPLWWPDLDAVYYALSFDQYAIPLGQWMLNFPPLLKFSTFVTLVLEWIGPLFLFVPIFTVFFRCATIITFIFLHIGFGLTLHIGLFPALGVFTWLVFLPSEVWDALGKRLYSRSRAGLRIYYDADCGFCKKVVHLLRTFLILPNTPLLEAQEEESIFAAMQEQNSWVVVDWQDNHHYKWEAIAYVCSLSPILWPLAPALRWGPLMALGTKFYETIASNRKFMGNFTKPLKFRPLEVRPSRSLNIITLLLFAYVTLWNFKGFVEVTARRDTLPTFLKPTERIVRSRTLQSLNWFSRIFRLDQIWSIFSPAPPRDDGWHVVVGKLQDGREIDVLTGKPVTWDKPGIAQRNALYPNMQWRTYYINLNRAIGKKLYPHYAQYLCREWNARHQEGEQLESFEIYFMVERTVPPGETQEVEKKSDWQQSCL